MDKKIFRKIMTVLLCGSVLISSNGTAALAQDRLGNDISSDNASDEVRLGIKDYTYNDFIYTEIICSECAQASITGYIGNDEELTIPEQINGLKVTDIDIERSGIFSKTVKKVNLPETGQIKDVNFRGCTKLESVNIPEGVKYIGDDAFEGCKSLKGIHIPSTVKHIYQEAFQNSGVEKVTISEGVRGIGQYAFYGCSRLESVTWPGSLRYIEMSAFSGTKLKKVKMKKCVQISNNAFSGCRYLEDVKLPAGLKSVYEDAFLGCPRLKKVTIPKSTLYICDAFSKNTKLYFESSSMRKYKGGGRTVYLKSVEIQVKGKYCYKEVQDVLNKINKQRKLKKLKNVSLSNLGLNAAMERAVYSAVIDNPKYEKPNGTLYTYKIPSPDTICGIGWDGVLKSKKKFIKQIMEDMRFRNIKAIGIGCVKIKGKYYYFAVADDRTENRKIVKKMQKDRSFKKNIAVKSWCIDYIENDNIIIKKGKKTDININAQLTGQDPYNMWRISEGRIVSKELKITSSNKNVVKVDKKGVITGVKRGTAKLKVCLKMNKKRSTVVKVKVV